MAEIGSITFNANPMSATRVKPPRGWPESKTTPAEELKEALDAFPKTIVMDGCTEIIDEVDEAVQRNANKNRCTTQKKAAEKDYGEMMEGLKPYGIQEDLSKEEYNIYHAIETYNPLSTGGHPMFNELLIRMSKLHEAKDHDYSHNNHLANFYVSEEFNIPAWKGCLIRLSDKFSRIKSIIKKGESKVTSESLEDTLLDLATYSLLVIILLKETEIGTQIEEEES